MKLPEHIEFVPTATGGSYVGRPISVTRDPRRYVITNEWSSDDLRVIADHMDLRNAVVRPSAADRPSHVSVTPQMVEVAVEKMHEMYESSVNGMPLSDHDCMKAVLIEALKEAKRCVS